MFISLFTTKSIFTELLHCSLELLCLVRMLPGEIHVGTSEVSIGLGLLIDGTAKVQHPYDACGTEVKYLPDCG